jgi:DNA-binding NarL/FixJ family response regulator
VGLVANGLSNQHIAKRPLISPARARTNVSPAMAKEVARDREQLVVVAYETELVGPGHAQL